MSLQVDDANRIRRPIVCVANHRINERRSSPKEHSGPLMNVPENVQAQRQFFDALLQQFAPEMPAVERVEDTF